MQLENMNKVRLLILATTALAMAACSGDTVEPTPGDAIELRLSSAISTGLTRGTYTPTQGTTLAAGEMVYAWVDDRGDATTSASEHVAAWTLTCQSDASLTGANKYYFPASGRSVNVYAIHGNMATTPVEGTTTWNDIQTVSHDILADQSTTGNYELSDFLYARNTTIARDNTVKTLTFKHQLSKIEIYLIAGNGLVESDITGATVKLKNIMPTATITLDKTTDDATVVASGTTVDIQCRMSYQTDVVRTVPDPDNTSSTVNKYAYGFAEAIVVPQWFSTDGTSTGSAQNFLEITLVNGIVLKSNLGPVQFEQGKKYGYNVTVNTTDLLLTSTITDWDDSGTQNIEAF